MAKKFRQFISIFLVLTTLFSYSNLLRADDTDETEPTETATIEESEPSESTESSEDIEPSETSETIPEETSESDPSESVSGTLSRTILDSKGYTYTVTASYDEDTGIPSDAELVVEEIISGEDYNDYYDKTIEVIGDQIGYVRFFDISIVKDGVEFEPNEGTTVNVKIQLADMLDSELSVIHFADDSDPAVVETTTVNNDEGTEIEFEADGFSAYAIVDFDKDPVVFGWDDANTFDEIAAHGAEGFYVSSSGNNVTKGHYLTGGIVTGVSGNADRNGLDATEDAYLTGVPDGIEKFYFTRVDGTEDKFIIYVKRSETSFEYLQMTNVQGNSKRKGLTFVSNADDATEFKLEKYKTGDNSFYISAMDGIYWVRNGAKNPPGVGAVVGYQAKDDTNAYPIRLQYKTEEISDPYKLDNKSYGLMYYDSGIAGKGLIDESSNAGSLDTLAMPVLAHKDDHEDRMFVPNDSDIVMWKIKWKSEDFYTFSAEINGETKYLNIGANGPEISDTEQSIRVTPGTGDNKGKISLSVGNNVLTYSGEINNGFVVNGTDSDRYRWLNLVEMSLLTSDYWLTYSAKKISVSDPALKNGDRVIVYTRVWNDSKKRYDFYAVDHDGTLVPCYEEGDEIQWIGDRINTLLWDYTIYYEKGKDAVKENENNFYELYNEYSEKYISPSAISDEVLDDSKIGINMVGRSDDEYYSPIVAWDTDNYAYAGVRTDNGRIISYPLYDPVPSNESTDFYFATIQDLNITDDLTTVETVDNTAYGMKMKLINFDVNGTDWKNGEQSKFLGNNAGGAVLTPQQGILSANLGPDGYPTVTHGTHAGESLAGLYDSRLKDVNHLFVSSTYMSSGYFEFDSTQNFAELGPDNNFKVYQELGTINGDGRKSLQHGQFLPFDKLDLGDYSTNLNMYTATQALLDDSDPRKYENLYRIDDPDYNFGMLLETSFVQTPDGHDDWDHDIIYEFTGDDDFWLYVDGVLVMDLGGIHSALKGTINYCTGEVYVQGASTPNTTLYAIFKKNYMDQGHTEQEAIAYLDTIFKQKSNGQYVFKDYSAHTMTIFFMERGQGASNLHMRFNQSSVKPDTVILGKELSGVDATESFYAEFPFQIYYQLVDGEPYQRLSNHHDNIQVYYRGTTKKVEYKDQYSVGGCNYEDVYFLGPGESCEINVPDGAIKYYIVECGVDTDIYDQVSANTTQLSGTTPEDREQTHSDTRMDFKIEPTKVEERRSVEFNNHVNPAALRTLSFTKVLWDEKGFGVNEVHDDPGRFDFRLSFATEHDDSTNMQLANMYIYHVKDEDGNYCRWDSTLGDFVSLGTNKNDYSALTDAEKRSASFTTSMNGTISRIPAFYTVEIREVLAGTKFQIEERYNEIPDGYSRIKYVVYADDSDASGTSNASEAIGLVDYDKDPKVEIHNLRGYAIRIYKNWADEKFLSDRENAYFALYIDNVLQPNMIYELPYGENTLYWYFSALETGKTLDNYHIWEVDIDDPVVDSDGKVTNWTSLTPIYNDNEIEIKGTLSGESISQDITYTAKYSSTYSTNNIRVDTITNNRKGLTIYKEDTMGNRMSGAYFDLRDETGKLIGSFVSDDNGLVTMAFLRKNVDYTLTETKSPSRYHGLDKPVTIRLNNDGSVTATAGVSSDAARIEVNNDDLNEPTVTVKNIRYDFTVSKKDKNTNQPIENVKFELHKQRTVGGVTVVDFHPMPGYENLLTDSNGIVSMIDSSLPAGTYELREVDTPITHHSLNYYILFTVSDTGDITLNAVHPEIDIVTTRETVLGEERLVYTLLIYNLPVTDDFTITKQVTGNMGNRNEEFPVTVTLTTATDQPYVGTFYTKKNNEDAVAWTLTAADAGKVTLSFKDGDRIVFTDLDENTKFSVTEDSKGYQSKGYRDGIYIDDSGTVTGNITDHHVVKFVNTRNGIIPTGVENSFNLSISIMCILTACVVSGRHFFFKRRTEEEEEC